MDWNKTNSTATHLSLVTALFCVLLSGCAGQRWAEPLPEEEYADAARSIAAMQKSTGECPDSLDADTQIFLTSPVNDMALEGYMQLFEPSFVKFIISNPLGQPVYAFASDGINYQILQARQYRHIRGTMRTLAVRHEIPEILLQGDWFSYLTGYIPTDSLEGVEIHRDISDRSVWLRLFPADTNRVPESIWIHINLLQKTVLGYLFLDSTGATVAEIRYANTQGDRKQSCKPEGTITITQLPWGAELTIKLLNISSASQFNDAGFSLPVPPGYTTQLRH